MRIPKIGLERIGLRKIGLCRVGGKGASSSLLPAKIVGISYAREIGTNPSAMGNGLLTSEKWAKVSTIKGNSVVDGEQILSYQQWGESVIWNQLANVNTKTTFGTVSTLRAYTGITLQKTLPINHKILATCKSTLTDKDGGIPDIEYRMYIGNSTGQMNQTNLVTTNGDTSYFFVTPSTDTRKAVGVRYDGTPTEGDTLLVENIYVYDLTLMFGEGNEPTTIEEFERRRPRNVTNEYNEGTEINGDIEIKTVGLNQWDEEWEEGSLNKNSGVNIAGSIAKRSANYTQLTKNTKYYCAYSNGTSNAVWLMFYDLNGMPISHPVGKGQSGYLNNVMNYPFVTPNQDCTVRFYTKNEPDSRVCLHLVQDGLVSQYKPYTSTTTPLPNVSLIKDADGNQLFPYGLCSAGSVHDEITATKAIKRVGVVDMGSLEWGYKTNEKDFLSNVFAPNPKYIGETLCAIYGNSKSTNADGQSNKTVRITNTYKIIVKDSSYTSVDDFKATMQGVLLYYELATPIEVEIDKWKAEYKVEQGGTEQIVSANDTTNLKTDIIYGNKV